MRLWRAFAIGVAVALLVSSVSPGKASASGPDRTLSELGALVERVTSAPDRDAAFRALSATDRAAVVNYITPVASVSGSSTTGSVSAAGDPCNTAHNWVRWNNQFGVTMFQFNHEVTWCWNYAMITNNPWTRTWVSNQCCGWEYMGLTNEQRLPQDGYGAWEFMYFSQGHFRWYYEGTWVARYPWLRTTVRGDGYYTFLNGVD